MKFKFKEEYTFDVRKAESLKITSKYQDRTPVIVEKDPTSNIQDIDKNKFIFPRDISIAQLMYIIRKRSQLPAEKPMFLFVGRIMPATSSTLGAVYDENKDEDGFLYMTYSGNKTLS